MTTQAAKGEGEGWGWPLWSKRKAHYFREGVSLCGLWHFKGHVADGAEGGAEWPYVCATCSAEWQGWRVVRQEGQV